MTLLFFQSRCDFVDGHLPSVGAMDNMELLHRSSHIKVSVVSKTAAVLWFLLDLTNIQWIWSKKTKQRKHLRPFSCRLHICRRIGTIGKAIFTRQVIIIFKLYTCFQTTCHWCVLCQLQWLLQSSNGHFVVFDSLLTVPVDQRWLLCIACWYQCSNDCGPDGVVDNVPSCVPGLTPRTWRGGVNTGVRSEPSRQNWAPQNPGYSTRSFCSKNSCQRL